MAKFKKLNNTLTKFIEKQPMFFVATAGREGRVNLSPKGMDTLRVVDDNTIAWLSLTGSGNESAAHVIETKRMTLMFCAFEGDAMILRTYGEAEVLYPHNAGWDKAIGVFPAIAGSRQIFNLQIDLVQTSCGTGVPIMHYQKGRAEEELVPYFDDLGPEGTANFWRKRNAVSIDGNSTGIIKTDSSQ